LPAPASAVPSPRAARAPPPAARSCSKYSPACARRVFLCVMLVSVIAAQCGAADLGVVLAVRVRGCNLQQERAPRGFVDPRGAAVEHVLQLRLQRQHVRVVPGLGQLRGLQQDVVLQPGAAQSAGGAARPSCSAASSTGRAGAAQPAPGPRLAFRTLSAPTGARSSNGTSRNTSSGALWWSILPSHPGGGRRNRLLDVSGTKKAAPRRAWTSGRQGGASSMPLCPYCAARSCPAAFGAGRAGSRSTE